jgi:hypothetical protein
MPVLKRPDGKIYFEEFGSGLVGTEDQPTHDE